MLQWDKKLVRQIERKKTHYFYAGAFLALIVLSLYQTIPKVESNEQVVRPISIEEAQGLLSVMEHLEETLPHQSLTIQNWMNKIDRGEIDLLISLSPDSRINFEKGNFILPSSFFDEDPITQQKNLSDAFGMRFDYLKAAEIAFSKE